MAKKNILQIILIVVLAIVLCIIVGLFINEKNTISTETNNSMFSQSGGIFFNMPNGDIGQPGIGNNANVSHSGSTEILTDTTNNWQTYSSTRGLQNSLLVTSGTSKISNATITKTGNSNDENSDFMEQMPQY